MDFELTDEQQMLKASVDTFVDRHCPPQIGKAVGRGEHVSLYLWRSMAELDWFGLPFPEEWGGGEGRPSISSSWLRVSGAPASTSQWRMSARLSPGLTVYEWGYDDRGYVSAMASCVVNTGLRLPSASQTQVQMRQQCAPRLSSGDGFVLNGQKMWCTGAGLDAALIAMYVRTDPSAARRRPG